MKTVMGFSMSTTGSRQGLDVTPQEWRRMVMAHIARAELTETSNSRACIPQICTSQPRIIMGHPSFLTDPQSTGN